MAQQQTCLPLLVQGACLVKPSIFVAVVMEGDIPATENCNGRGDFYVISRTTDESSKK